MDQGFEPGNDPESSINLDVDAELEFLQRFKDLGLSIGDMENVLFTDIERYKLMKVQLLKNTFHEENGDSLPIEDIQEHIEGIPDDTPIPSESYEEDMDLLLLGSPMDENVQDDSIDLDSISLGTDQEVQTIEETLYEDDIDQDLPDDPDFAEDIDETPNIYKEDDRLLSSSRKYKGSKPILVGIIAILLVILIIGTFSIFNVIDDGETPDEELDVSITISDVNPLAGVPVFLKCNPDDPDLDYRWKIIPEGYSIITGNVDSSELEIFFKEMERFQISVTVSRDSKQYISSEDINVQSTNIELEREHYNDIAEYDVEGHLRLDRIDHLVESSELKPYTVLETNFWTTESSPMTMEISDGLIDSKDGLGYVNKNIVRTTTQDLKLSGYLEGPGIPRSTTTGATNLVQTSNIDIYTKEPTQIISDVDYDLDIQITSSRTFNYISSEKVYTFPSLQNTFSELRIEDISPERYIALGDSGTTQWGSYSLNWETVEYDRILDTETLILDLSVDQSTKNRLSIDEIELRLWVGDGIGQILKMVLNVSSERNVQIPYILDYSQTIISLSKGDEPVIFGSIDLKHDEIDHISTKFTDIMDEFHSDWTYFPEYGNMFSSIPSDFTAQDAFAKFEDNPNFKAYMRTQSDPFGLYSNFSTTKGQDQWKFSIGDDSKDRCWNQTVFREAAPLGKTSKIDPVMNDREDIGSILTYSGGEIALKRLLSEIYPSIAQETYGLSQIPDERLLDLDNFYIGTAADLDYPVIGLVNPTLSERIDFGMFIASNDGNIEVGLDMKTGQLSYIRISA